MAGTVVAEGLTFEGELVSEEDVAIEGTLRGTLSTRGDATIGAEGTVQADVTAASVTVAGVVTGDVAATQRVDIQAGGRLIGNVRAARFTIADGASFKGSVDMEV